MTPGKPIRQLAGETAIYGISGIIAQMVNILLVPLYTHVFSPAENGLINILTSLTGLISAFIVLGLDSASARFYYDSDDSHRRHQVISSWFWCQLGFGMVVVAGIALASRLIARTLLDSEKWIQLVILMDLAILTRSIIKVFGNWMRYQRRAWIAIGFSVISTLLLVGLTLGFVLPGRMGLLGVYRAQLCAGIVTALIAVFFLGDWISPRYISMDIIKEMLVYGFPLIPAALAAWVTASADRFFLHHFRNSTEIGIYGVAVAIASAVTLATGAFQMAWGPFAFSILKQGDAKKIYSRTLTMFGFWGSWLATGLSLMSPVLLRWFTAPPFYSASSCVFYLAFGYLAIGATYIAALGSSIVKKSTPVAISIFLGAGVNTLLNFILIPSMGKDGAAVSTLVAYSTATIYLFIRSQTLFLIPYRFWDVGFCVALSGVVIAVDRLFLPVGGFGAYAIRSGMIMLFIPLAFYLKIITVDKLKRACKKMIKLL